MSLSTYQMHLDDLVTLKLAMSRDGHIIKDSEVSD